MPLTEREQRLISIADLLDQIRALELRAQSSAARRRLRLIRSEIANAGRLLTLAGTHGPQYVERIDRLLSAASCELRAVGQTMRPCDWAGLSLPK